MNGICGIHHLSLKATAANYFQTVTFYRDILGLGIVRQQDSATFLSCGNTVLEILNTDEVPESGTVLDHFAFFAPDVESVVERVRRAGYQITREPEDYTFPGTPPYNVHIAFFCGPCGESVELFCER